MKAIDPGHYYKLDNYKNPKNKQEIKFINKKLSKKTGELKLVHDGVTTEEVLSMVHDRISYLNRQVPHQLNNLALLKIEGALKALGMREKDRTQRGVKGTNKP